MVTNIYVRIIFGIFDIIDSFLIFCHQSCEGVQVHVCLSGEYRYSLFPFYQGLCLDIVIFFWVTDKKFLIWLLKKCKEFSTPTRRVESQCIFNQSFNILAFSLLIEWLTAYWLTYSLQEMMLQLGTEGAWRKLSLIWWTNKPTMYIVYCIMYNVYSTHTCLH